MEKIHCDVRNKDFYSDESCLYEQRKIENPTKVCVRCDYYKSLRAKTIKRKDPIEKAINRFSKASRAPKDNVRFYLNIYKKINKAREDSKFLIKALENINVDHLNKLQKAINYGWLQENEAAFLWGCWQHFMIKKENTNKFSISVLEDYFLTDNFKRESPKKGKRVNPSLEFLSWALVKDAEEFGGKPCYKEISKFLSSIDKQNSYTEATLKGKYPRLKIPGAKEDRRPRILFKALFINQTLIMTKAYLDAKGESFLPDPLPTKPKGYVRSILQVLGIIPEEMPISHGIRIPKS